MAAGVFEIWFGQVSGRNPHLADLMCRRLKPRRTRQRQLDDGRVFNLLPVWAPDAAVRKTILVENPAKLYGF